MGVVVDADLRRHDGSRDVRKCSEMMRAKT